jgi:hypothetical protein
MSSHEKGEWKVWDSASGSHGHGHQSRNHRVHPQHQSAPSIIYPGIRAMAGRYRPDMPHDCIAGLRHTTRPRCAGYNPHGRTVRYLVPEFTPSGDIS